MNCFSIAWYRAASVEAKAEAISNAQEMNHKRISNSLFPRRGHLFPRQFLLLQDALEVHRHHFSELQRRAAPVAEEFFGDRAVGVLKVLFQKTFDQAQILRVRRFELYH